MDALVVALVMFAGEPEVAPVVEAPSKIATGMWVGLRGGPPKLRTALAAALQTQATIRGIIDRVAPDVVSLQACAWNEIDCFVRLGEHHESRVLVVADLAKLNGRYRLRVARINVDQGLVIAELRMELDPSLSAIDVANQAIAGLTSEVVAAPRVVATPTESAATPKPKRRARALARADVSRRARR
ncbi:MAG TPA: hypothetical protein VG755_07140 [Nannocystaceae bacterium]|nr:hypothetical protein [Nannocystaceae bacterium]